MWVFLVTLKLLQLEQSEAGLWLFEIQSCAHKSQLAVGCISLQVQVVSVSRNVDFHSSLLFIIFTGHWDEDGFVSSLFLLFTFNKSKSTLKLERSTLPEVDNIKKKEKSVFCF